VYHRRSTSQKDKYGKGGNPLNVTAVKFGFQSQVEMNSINGSPKRLSGDAESIDHRHRKEEVPYGHHSVVP
jgi:hypothetical protein